MTFTDAHKDSLRYLLAMASLEPEEKVAIRAALAEIARLTAEHAKAQSAHLGTWTTAAVELQQAKEEIARLTRLVEDFRFER